MGECLIMINLEEIRAERIKRGEPVGSDITDEELLLECYDGMAQGLDVLHAVIFDKDEMSQILRPNLTERELTDAVMLCYRRVGEFVIEFGLANQRLG